MKKIIQKALCFLLVLGIIISYGAINVSAESVSYFSDFEEFEIGESQVGIGYNNGNSETASALVAYDPLDKTNKVYELCNDGVNDKYLSLKGDYSHKTHIRFKFYNPKGNNVRIYFRDSISTANNIEMLAVSGTTITAFKQKITYDTSKWVSLEFVMDFKNDSISLYTDIANKYNGVVKLSASAKPSEVFKTYGVHTIDNTTMRVGLMKNAGRIYLDDFEVVQNLSKSQNLFVKGVISKRKIMNTFDTVSSLRSGQYEFSSEIEGVGDGDNAQLFAAHYNKDGLMKGIGQSEKYFVSPGQKKTFKADLNIADIDEGDYVKMFLFDGKDNIRPVSGEFMLNQTDLYYRPSAMEILEDFYKNHPNEEDHPRVIRTKEEFSVLRNYLKTDSDFKALYDSVKAATSLKPTLPKYVFDERNTMLEQSRKAMNGIFPLAFLYQMAETETEKTTYAEAVWRIASVVCDKEIFPDWNHHTHYLDTGEMGLAVAIAYDWCYDYWNSEQKKIMETALYDNIIEISLGVFEDRYTYSGLEAKTNWNPVCNGGSITAAAAVLHKFPEECSKLISHSTKAIEICLPDYAPKGGYSESPTYWAYGTTYLMWCISTLDSACGQSYGIEKAPGLSTTGYFPSYAMGPTGNWNYHDGGTGLLDTSLSMFFADKFSDANLAGLRMNFLKNGFYGNTVKPNFKDLLFYNSNLINDDFNVDELDIDCYYPGIETVFMRESFLDKKSIFTGLHGGYNSTNHGDMDAGTFILDADGVRFIDELGADRYALPGYFGKGDSGKSWQYYRKGAEGQNTIMIADDDKIPYGQKATATVKIVDFKAKSAGTYAVADMTPALGSKVVEAKRGVMLTDYRTEVIVQDEITFNAPTELYWLAHTRGNILIDDSGKRAVIERNGKYMAAYLISDNDKLEFEAMDAQPLLPVTYTGGEDSGRNGIRKLVIHAKDVESFNAAVVFRQINNINASSNYSYDYTEIENWQLSDLPMPSEDPYLNMIYIDGTPVSGFSKAEKDYKYIIPFDAADNIKGEISFEAPEGYRAELKDGEVAAQKIIEVYHSATPDYVTKYFIYVSRAPEQVSDGNYAKYNAVSATATSEPEANHTAENAIDGNLDAESRWSAEISGAALTIDLGEAKVIDGISLSFYKGLFRNYTFDIMYSSNGKVFSNYKKGMVSSGLTDGEEIFKFDNPLTARYIRFKGYGNNENEWNSVVEFAALYKL